jgi:hypothetical protein
LELPNLICHKLVIGLSSALSQAQPIVDPINILLMTMKILVVDDDRVLADLVSFPLRLKPFPAWVTVSLPLLLTDIIRQNLSLKILSQL